MASLIALGALCTISLKSWCVCTRKRAEQREALAPRAAHPRVDRRVEPRERHGEALHAHAHRTVGLLEGREERGLPPARARVGHARQDGKERLRRLGAAARRGCALDERPKVQQVAHVGHGVQLGRGHHELAHQLPRWPRLAQQILDASPGTRRAPRSTRRRSRSRSRAATSARLSTSALGACSSADDRRARSPPAPRASRQSTAARSRRSAWPCGSDGAERQALGSPTRRVSARVASASVPRSAAALASQRAHSVTACEKSRTTPTAAPRARWCAFAAAVAQPPSAPHMPASSKVAKRGISRLEDAAAPLHQFARGASRSRARAGAGASLGSPAGADALPPAGWQKCAIGDSSAAPTLRCSSAASRCGP